METMRPVKEADDKANEYNKTEQIHRYREETSGYQCGEGWGEAHDWGKGLRVTNYQL